MGARIIQSKESGRRKQRAIAMFTSLKGNITAKEIGDRLGVTEHTVLNYISGYFKAIRDNKNKF